VSALGGIGGQEVNFTDKRNWWVELGSRVVIGLADTANGNATHDADIRVGQDGR
jgi:hypothetical protein